MAKRKKESLPDCGLYRTGRALKSNPEGVPKGVLVMFHNHSNRNIPFVQLPEENTHNVWTFNEYGPGIEDDDAFIDALEPLREQGFYFLREPLEVTDGVLPAQTLVQLGYNRDAEPIFFQASRDTYENALNFPESGYGFTDASVLDVLAPEQPLIITGYNDEEDDHVHMQNDPSEGLLN
ncbi:MAG: hypothetical protein EP343_22210 [Deltaproteobacteria bacterium]|nr:MAG: hypothetical protein EP343_22210 [Deltaproteobacteria bacterium]